MDEAAAELARPAHHLQLERLAAKALAAKDFNVALKFSDRRCRIEPPAPAHCFVLRAEAAWRHGLRDTALADLASALQIAPHDLGANRRMLTWADDDRQTRAAAELLAHDVDWANLRAAISVLRNAGESCWASLSVFDDEMTGWIAWSVAARIEACLTGEDASLTSEFEADPFHPLATSSTQATALHLRRSLPDAVQMLTLRIDGRAFRTVRLPARLRKPLRSPAKFATPTTPPQPMPATVIVPVYGDADATLACLGSLRRAVTAGRTTRSEATSDAGPPFRILVVDDASPEPGLKAHLQAMAALGEIELLVNPVNLGFIGAVNRALSKVTDGDVVLLNSDTIVAPGFVDRLATAAHSAPDIGTVTPLSNNGEFFSFPEPDTANPMPSEEDIVALDRVAARANPDTVDVPSGIGFCLYITRACLDRLGGLSESFERGYLEDVDFCLRARAAGFRSVCAPSVYVGHHGSRSFQRSKRALVLRNLEILDRRFPFYRNECRAMESVDPLRRARATLEAALPCDQPSPVLIAAGRGVARMLAETRARQLEAGGQRVILIVAEHDRFRLMAADGRSPQSRLLHLGSSEGISEAEAELARLRPSHLELIDPATPQALVHLARQLGLRIDRWMTTADMLSSSDGEDLLLAPTEQALGFARARLGSATKRVQLSAWETTPPVLPKPDRERPKALVIAPATASALAWRAIRMLALSMLAAHRSTPVVVLGETFADGRLMSFPNLFVTGPITVHDLHDGLAPYNPGWVLTDFEDPVFGHPLVETIRQARLPVAYRDWSAGSIETRDGDLAVPAAIDDEALVIAVTRWIAKGM